LEHGETLQRGEFGPWNEEARTFGTGWGGTKKEVRTYSLHQRGSTPERGRGFKRQTGQLKQRELGEGSREKKNGLVRYEIKGVRTGEP